MGAAAMKHHSFKSLVEASSWMNKYLSDSSFLYNVTKYIDISKGARHPLQFLSETLNLKKTKRLFQ